VPTFDRLRKLFGEVLLATGAIPTFIHILDWFGRAKDLKDAMNAMSPLIAHPLFPAIVIVVGLLLLFLSDRRKAAAAPIIYDHDQRPIRVKVRSTVKASVVSIGVGFAMAALLWLIYSHTGTADTTLTENGRLDLVFTPGGISSGQDAIMFHEAIASNRSMKNMSLDFILGIQYLKDGKAGWYWMNGRWNGERGVPTSGATIVEVARESTKTGVLVFNLGRAAQVSGLPQWDIDLEKGASLQIRDRISGIKIVCHPEVGYPPLRRSSCRPPGNSE
jgi:hypothetical protein